MPGIYSAVSIIFPALSAVSVFAPNCTVKAYCFLELIRILTSFVASPIAIGKTPSASRSRVPVCPTLLGLNERFTIATTFAELIPLGLYMFSQPFITLFS